MTRSNSRTMSRREPLERLVEQEKPRIEHQRAADREHLLLAARKLRAEVRAPLAEPREELVHARRRPAAGTRDRREIFLDRERFPDVAFLRHPAQTRGGALVRTQRRNGPAGQLDDAAAIARDADQRGDERRLAGAVAAKHGKRLPFLQREAYPVEDDGIAVARAQSRHAK